MKSLHFHARPFIWSSAGAALVCVSAAIAIATVYAQPPARGVREGGEGGVESALKRLMAFDANNDGKLTQDEITDSRLAPLLQRADANNDGIVTKEELTAQLGKEAAIAQQSDRGGPGGGGRGGPGGPGGRGLGGGPGGGGPGGRGGPGQVLPPFLQDELNLTDAQKRDVQELQKDVEARLAKILTTEQQQQLQQIRSRGPGGGPGGPGGFGPPPEGGPRGEGNNSERRPQRPQ